jgi:aminomethyltransferase
MRQTKLHAWHLRAGARMLEFGGWDMPVLYPAGPREEHLRVRSAAGLFDIDHMGRFEVTGKGARELLQRVQTWDAASVPQGRAHYSLLCSESGGILDDIFIYRMAAGEGGGTAAEGGRWLVVVNASNAAKDFAWLQSHAKGMDVDLRDVSAETCMMALQGPSARSILQGLADLDLSSFPFHAVAECTVAGARAIVCSTGYTGEPGYELLVSADRGEAAWEAILAAGAPAGLLPCGLAARDTLRAEACLPLYGHEIDEQTDPFSAGLASAAVAMDGRQFVGRQALARIAGGPLARRLVGFEMTEPGVPRQGYTLAVDGRPAGRVTTGLFSPSTGRYLGLGYVEEPFSRTGQEIQVVIRDAAKAALVARRPFYKSPHWR